MGSPEFSIGGLGSPEFSIGGLGSPELSEKSPEAAVEITVAEADADNWKASVVHLTQV